MGEGRGADVGGRMTWDVVGWGNFSVASCPLFSAVDVKVMDKSTVQVERGRWVVQVSLG